MNRRSKKGAILQKEVAQAKMEVRAERPNVCECCYTKPSFQNPLDTSHNYPVKHFEWLASEKWNITLLIRDHHDAWERNRFWEVNQNGAAEKLIKVMWERALAEPDMVRQKTMMDHVRNRIIKCGDFREGSMLSEKLFDFIRKIG